MEIKRVGRIGSGRSSTGKVLKRVVHWSGDGFTWEAYPRLIEKLITLLNLSGGKGALTLAELEYSDAKLLQSAAGLEQYIGLDCPDTAYSVKTAFAASRCLSWALLEEQSEVGVEVPVSTATEKRRRVCGC